MNRTAYRLEMLLLAIDLHLYLGIGRLVGMPVPSKMSMGGMSEMKRHFVVGFSNEVSYRS